MKNLTILLISSYSISICAMGTTSKKTYDLASIEAVAELKNCITKTYDRNQEIPYSCDREIAKLRTFLADDEITIVIANHLNPPDLNGEEEEKQDMLKSQKQLEIDNMNIEAVRKANNKSYNSDLYKLYRSVSW